MSTYNILQPGRNCWRIRHANRVSFLIDAENYFNALHSAVLQTTHEINILSWDIYSELKIGALRGDNRPICQLLDDQLNKYDSLSAHILNWDFAMLVAMSREWLPVYRFGWMTHPRLQFEMDGKHPVGGSHHQKLVVLDNQLAFTGGLDLTRGRWDTQQHKPYDRRRKKIDGTTGRPYHDVQVALSGDVASALNDLARERWRRATGNKFPQSKETSSDLWPDDLPVDIENVDVAISRTMPAYSDYELINESEQLYLDAIAAAREYVYIENQFYTSPSVNNALIDSLKQPEGPQVVINMPLQTEGWISQQSMDVIRVKLIQKLRQADTCNRLEVFFPDKQGLKNTAINLHAKVMICDDRFVRVGSSNLNNRSMVLDSECDIAIECDSDDERIKQGIRDFRNRLLSEHLGMTATDFDEVERSNETLLDAIRSCNNGSRSLKPLEDKLPDYENTVLTESELVDPQQGLSMDSLMYHFIPDGRSESALRINGWVIALILFLALAAGWRYTPLSEWLSIDQIINSIDYVRSVPMSPVLLVLGFVLAGVLMVPVTLLIIASVVVFGPWLGGIYALLSAVTCALFGYVLGSWMGRDVIQQFAGGRINRISKQLARRGIFTIVVLRIVPVAPFTIINLVAGASHISWRDFFWGSLIGLLPGVTAIALLTDRVRSTVVDPQPETIALLVLVAVVVLGSGFYLSRHLIKARQHQDG